MRARLAPVRNGLMRRRAAPEVEPAIAERALVRIELRPHRRMHAVAGDQHVALGGGSAAPSAPTKRAVTRPPPCSTPMQRWPRMTFSAPIRSRTAPSSTRCRSERKQRDVRPQVPGRLAPGLAIDELAVAGEEGVVLRLAGGRDQLVLQPERAHLLHRVRRRD